MQSRGCWLGVLVIFLSSCSLGNGVSSTTFQKKRYSRGYYVHKAKDRSVPNSTVEAAVAPSESQDKPAPSSTEVVPPVVAGNTEPTPIQSSRLERAQPGPLRVSIPPREVTGMAHQERSLLLPDPVAESEAFHGVDMEADPEPELKWHRTTWISLAMIATSLALMVSGASGLFLLTLPALAWFPATYALLKSNAERSHTGKGINRILFFSTLAWFVLYLAFILPWWGNFPYFGWQ